MNDQTLPASINLDRKALRQRLRASRRALTATEQHQAASKVARQALQHPRLRTARHIALYLPNDGEVDLRPLTRQLWCRGVRCYLPVLSRRNPGHLLFRRFTQQTWLQRNHLGIPEPRGGHTLVGQQLDLVLLPLVGFDRRGNRLGMGGGFYDRTFARPGQRPPLIGIAHQCQQVDTLPHAGWDVPLQAVITDRQIIRCR